MKAFKWFGAAGAIVALGSAGFLSSVPGASGATITITAGTGSSVSCTIAGTAKLAPTLVNDWSQAQHSGANADPNANATVKAAMASIPNDTFSAGTVAVTTSSKVSATCTGTVTDGTNTTGVASATITSSSISAGTSEATCSGLASPGSSTFSSTIAWKGTGTTKIANTTSTLALASLVDTHGVGFDLTANPSTAGTSISGSFAGGSTETKAYIDGTTLNAIAGGPSTFDTPSTSVCEATLSSKFTPAGPGVSDSVAIKLKKPKGLKQITIGPGLFDNTPSSLTISK